jgi:hypothetical protein
LTFSCFESQPCKVNLEWNHHLASTYILYIFIIEIVLKYDPKMLSFKTRKSQRLTLSWNSSQLSTWTHKCHYSCKSVNVNGLKINLQLWDIPGHERFGGMTRVHYKVQQHSFMHALLKMLKTWQNSLIGFNIHSYCFFSFIKLNLLNRTTYICNPRKNEIEEL